jgi:hypothetical protein
MSNAYADTNARIALDTTVARLNIERFCKMLSGEANQTLRRTLVNLIAEENAKLGALVGGALNS